VAVSPIGTHAGDIYVANDNDGTVSVIDPNG
jgi:YVTN family beta-propeller protein